jgi:hypothetical protein
LRKYCQRRRRTKAAERKQVLRALLESGGKVGGDRGAAARLGVPRTTLQSRMRSSISGASIIDLPPELHFEPDGVMIRCRNVFTETGPTDSIGPPRYSNRFCAVAEKLRAASSYWEPAVQLRYATHRGADQKDGNGRGLNSDPGQENELHVDVFLRVVHHFV